ncbi:MAG TPA: hypothetical protein VIN56_06865 [Candidatus Dormibacteraeota bacterium]
MPIAPPFPNLPSAPGGIAPVGAIPAPPKPLTPANNEIQKAIRFIHGMGTHPAEAAQLQELFDAGDLQYGSSVVGSALIRRTNSEAVQFTGVILIGQPAVPIDVSRATPGGVLQTDEATRVLYLPSVLIHELTHYNQPTVMKMVDGVAHLFGVSDQSEVEAWTSQLQAMDTWVDKLRDAKNLHDANLLLDKKILVVKEYHETISKTGVYDLAKLAQLEELQKTIQSQIKQASVRVTEGGRTLLGLPLWIPGAGVGAGVLIGVLAGVGAGLQLGPFAPVPASHTSTQGSHIGGDQPPAATFDFVGSGYWHHNGPGDSTLFECVVATPADAGADYNVAFEGPSGFNLQMMGKLDSKGKATSGTAIHQYGPYRLTWQATSKGTAKEHTATIDVTPTQDSRTSCP